MDDVFGESGCNRMKTLNAAIADCDRMKALSMAIALGEVKPGRNQPKV